MDLLRDLIRDLIGIIFPGSLVLLLGLWFTYGIYILLYPSLDLLEVTNSMGNLTISFILLAMSYIAGQFLRTYKPGEITKNNPKNKVLKDVTKELDAASYNQIPKNIRELYELVREKENEFPYPYRQKSRRLQGYPPDYNIFYDKIDEKGILQKTTFFEFCKSVIYEYSPALKEEMLRETALVRLFTGLYYISTLGLWLTLSLIIIHIISLFNSSTFSSYGILLISIIIGFVLLYTKLRIPKIIKRIRQRETNIVYDGFYLLCQRHQILKEAFDKRINA